MPVPLRGVSLELPAAAAGGTRRQAVQASSGTVDQGHPVLHGDRHLQQRENGIQGLLNECCVGPVTGAGHQDASLERGAHAWTSSNDGAGRAMRSPMALLESSCSVSSRACTTQSGMCSMAEPGSTAP